MENAHYFALIIFIFAGFTDFLDGYIARKYHVISTFGTVFDPLADKLMLLVSLLSLYLDQNISLWVLVIMIAKEAFMILTGIYLYFRKEKWVIPSNIFGKLATAVFSLAVVLLILSPETQWLQYLLILAVAIKLTAFFSYARFIVLHKKRNPMEASNEP